MEKKKINQIQIGKKNNSRTARDQGKIVIDKHWTNYQDASFKA